MANLSPAVVRGGKPAHFDLIKASIPDWLTQAPPSVHRLWQAALSEHIAASHAVQGVIDSLPTPTAFVEPLLTAALHQRFNRAVDVTCIELWRLRHHKELYPDIPLRYVGEAQVARTRVAITRQTLIEAAMANFSSLETTASAFEAGSTVLAPGVPIDFDAYGKGPWYDAAQVIDIAPHEFAQVCRELDLGRRYQDHLRGVLETPRVTALLQADVAADIRLHANGAHARQWLSDEGLQVVQGMLEEGRAQWHGHPVQVCGLRMLGALDQVGIALQRALVLQPRLSGQARCVLYLAGDPHHPVREYASLAEVADYLRGQLRQQDYGLGFLGQIALADRAEFARRLHNALRPLPFWSLGAGEAQRVDDPDADLVLRAAAVSGAPHVWLQQRQVTGILADARRVVVPNDDEDRHEREARLALWEAIGLNLANVAGFFVPGVGTLLLGATAVQLLGDLVIGIEQWQHSERVEALAHFADIAQTLAVTALAAGAALTLRPSPLMENLLPVLDGQGRTRLMKATLHDFALSQPLPADLMPNRLGQYRFDDAEHIVLDGRVYRLAHDPAAQRWRVVHPDPAQSAGVELRHNGQGTWRAVHERVERWSLEQSMARLGAEAHGLDGPVLDRLRRTARLSETGLRELHRHNHRIPAALREAMADAQAQRLVDRPGEWRNAVELRLPPHALSTPAGATLGRDFPGLPPSLVEEIAAGASAPERRLLSAGRVPMRQAEQARRALQDWQLDRAINGLWLPAWASVDSQTLWQGTLARVPEGLAPQAGRLWVYEYAVAHRDAAAALLGQRRAPSWWRPPVRSANGRVGYALSGRGPALIDPIAQRLRALYPAVTDAHFNQLLAELGEDRALAVSVREQEFEALVQQLEQWQGEAAEWVDGLGVRLPVEVADREAVADEIRAAWRRETGLIFAGMDWATASDLYLGERHIGELPALTADFSHVYSLGLSDMGLHGDPSAFLARFPRVQALELQSNALTRIPPAVEHMTELRGLTLDENPLSASDTMFDPLAGLAHLEYLVLGNQPEAPPLQALQRLAGLTRLYEFAMPNVGALFTLAHWQALREIPNLERLWLGNNRLALTPPMVEVIAGMRGLTLLDLHGNPLVLAPVVGELHDLQMLDVRDCGLTQWPSGLDGLMAIVDGPLRSVWLQNNPIVEIPVLANLAYFRRPLRSFNLSTQHLDALGLQRLHRAQRVHAWQPDLGLGDLPAPQRPSWLVGATPGLLASVEALRSEPRAGYFLEALERAEDMASYRRDPPAGRVRVQALVSAISELAPGEDSQGLTRLREDFFDIGEEAITTCGDGIQLLLTRCETLLLIYRAAARPGADMPALLNTARGVLRAELVDEAALRIVQGREARQGALARGDQAPDSALSSMDEPALAIQPLALDEAEVRLRLRLDLAQRLALPPQAERMLYALQSSPAQLDRVQAYVLAQLTDARLIDWLVEQPWWQGMLERRSPEALAEARRPWLQAQQYLYEVTNGGAPVTPLAPHVRVRLGELFPDREWGSQSVALSVDEQEVVRQALLAGQRQAEGEALTRLTQALV
ncbi:leucine-rich repeat domain-containing protein [Pseudomonas sp. dw_358]|uniref:leucine-rich repeat domain-containing protein n=1 Tax=Pseudomonas sp. dw_358 TaxID=2720083 RepID=UPI001BD40C87|nr:leucine-rich repeat domain-containing protein [Pseudomonas sp. dw_358]